MKQREIKFRVWWNNLWNKFRDKTFITCKDCGIKRWVKNALINRAPNRRIYCWECDTKREQVKNNQKEIKRQKSREKTYCKNREHNYIGIYNEYTGVVEYVCSKCGKKFIFNS